MNPSSTAGTAGQRHAPAGSLTPEVDSATPGRSRPVAGAIRDHDRQRWVVVRRSPDGTTWLDVRHTAGHAEAALALGWNEDRTEPLWAHVNPIVEVALVQLTILETIPAQQVAAEIQAAHEASKARRALAEDEEKTFDAR